MSKKMKKCKSCGNDIASSAKTCPNCGAKSKKPILKKWWFWLIIVIVVVLAISSSGDNDSVDTASAEKSTVSAQSDKVKEDEKDTTSAVSIGKINALGSAKTYLWTMAFSYEGLVHQLEFEGYTEEEAIYAADNCGADWNEQAAKKAKEYLNTMSFSRSGLIEQLEFEGFTHEQAVYGAESVGY